MNPGRVQRDRAGLFYSFNNSSFMKTPYKDTFSFYCKKWKKEYPKCTGYDLMCQTINWANNYPLSYRQRSVNDLILRYLKWRYNAL